MDKNKSRTDLLAAGRKKLQQFRQKKDGKSSSHGKSSKKSSKTEQHDSDADVVSTTGKSTALLQVPEGESVSHVDADLGTVDSSAATDVEAAGVDPLSITMTPMGIAEAALSHNANICAQEVGVHDNDFDSSDPNEGKSTQTFNDEVLTVDPLGIPDVTYSEGEAKLADAFVNIDVSAAPAIAGPTDGTIIESESISRGEGKESLASQRDTPDISLINARGDQEADGLGSRQFAGSCDVGLKGGGILALAEHGDIVETGAASQQSGVEEMASQLKQAVGVDDIYSSANATDRSDEFLAAALTVSTTDGTLGAVHVVTDQREEVVNPDLSDVEKSEMLSESGHCGNNRQDGDQADAVVAENQQYVPEESFVFVGKSHERHLSMELANTSEGHIIFPFGDVSPISLSHLIEVMRGLSEDEYRLLLKSIGSNSIAELGTSNLISPEHGLSGLLERLKEELFLTNFTKDILHLQLMEQSDLQTEYNRQFHQFNDEMSVLRSSLKEAYERSDYLTEELAECRSELQATVSGWEKLQHQFHAAKAEVKEVSARANELENSLERSQSDLFSLSKESADCKDLMAMLQVENEKLQGILASLNEERQKFVEEKDACLHENEKLLKELADCKNLVAALQLESSSVSGTLASVTEERKKLEGEKDYLADENEKLSMELSDCKSLVEALQLENANISGKLALVADERKKLEEEKNYSVHEVERVSTELLVLHERLAKDHGERMQLEVELQEVMAHLEQLTRENMCLHSTLDIHKAKMREFDDRQFQVSTNVGEVVNQVGSLEIQSKGCENSTDDDLSLQIPGKRDGEAMLEKPIPYGLAEGQPSKLFEQEVFDDSCRFVVLKRHLEEAENVLLELEKAIEGMHSHSVFLSRSGGKVAAPAVSKLIQAFESKVHHDEVEADERAGSEDQSPSANPFASIQGCTGNMKALLEQLALDVETASLVLKMEQDGRSTANLTLSELQAEFEVLKKHSNDLEATNVELGVLYEAVKQHMFGVKEKNKELEVLCETLKQKESNLRAENCELGGKMIENESRIEELQSHLHELQQSSDQTASSLCDQLESFQKEATERALTVKQEWNSTVAQIVEAVNRLDDSNGFSLSSTISADSHGSLDVSNRISASVGAAIKVIEDLREKLEAAHTDHEATLNLFKEVHEKCNELLGQNELANGTLHRLYHELRRLVIDSSGSLEEAEINIGEELPDSVDYTKYKTLMEQLENFLAERLQLQSANSKLNLDLMTSRDNVEELNKRCLDLSSIEQLIEDVERVVKLEDANMDSDRMPLSRLESLVSFLVHKYKETNEQLSSSREDIRSKVMELTKLQENIRHLSALKLQHENEILLLNKHLSQAEEAVVAMRSELQEKVSELEQSEQRVSSIREKLGIAVAKGKGLVVQRDSLKQSMAETSSELERCLQELQLKDAMLQEVETRLKTYSEAGERVEALESELSYIRNSATALRESFLLKDSVLQRIEEILEDLDLPEDFHSRDIIEKVGWLARTATGNSLPPPDWDQKSSLGGSYSDIGVVAMDGWKEDVQPSSNSADDLRRQYEELQSKFYGLAEQNEMLEQSLMERNHLVQRWEEILDRINMPSHLRSVEPEDRIEWLGSALLEANHDRNSLLQRVDKLENSCGSLIADLEESHKRISYLNAEMEESQKRISNLEMELEANVCERENLSGKLETVTCDCEKLSAKAVQFELENEKLQKEVISLQENLAEKIANEERVQCIDGKITRLRDLVCDALLDPSTEDLVSGGSSADHLEGLLRKLVENYTALSSMKPSPGDAVKESHAEKDDANPVEGRTRDTVDTVVPDVALLKRDSVDNEKPNVDVLRKELEQTLREMVYVKEERDGYREKQQSLVCEVDALDRKRVELQELLNQEEQKSASLREKLNVAVRKGKSLVQERNSLKQTIEEMNTELEHLKSEIKHRESAFTDYEQKKRDLTTYSERVEAVESESLLLRNRLAETEHLLQEKGHTLTMILNALRDIDVGGEIYCSDPIEKLGHIGKLYCDLNAAVASSEQESRKSRRAAELLLAELKEVQDRNDGLQDELEKATIELAELSRGRDMVQAAKLEAVSCLEKLSAVQSEEKKKQYSDLLVLKSAANQLRKSFSDIRNLLAGVFSKDMEFLQSLEAGMESCLKGTEVNHVVHVPVFSVSDIITSNNSGNKESFLSMDFSETNTPDHLHDNFVIEISSPMQEIMKEIDALEELSHEHSVALHEQASSLSKLLGIFHGEMISQKDSFEGLKRDIKEMESIEKERDMEIVALRRNVSLLYEACTSSLLEIENKRAEVLENNLAAGDLGMNFEPATFADGGLSFGKESNFSSEEHIKTMVERLLLVVKDFANVKGEIVEGNRKEMKITISNLQKQLHERDIQRERICMELVGQIKEAEAAVASYSQDLQASKTHAHDLEKQMEKMEEERNSLDQRVKRLQDEQAISTELQHRVRSLTDVITAKDQEIEALMQALNEEEVQMEDLTNRIDELEKAVRQKNSDIENLESSRGKVLKKLSITVNKFDELHHFSESLLAEVEKLQSQLQDRDTEISFLRQEVTRCTNDVLVASQMSNKRNSDVINELLRWLDALVSQVGMQGVNLDGSSQVADYKEIIQKKLTAILSELEDLRVAAQSRDALLQMERSKIEELTRREETLQKSLREKESQLNVLEGVGDSGQPTSVASEILEVEPVINKWTVSGPSAASQVRSLRKANNDQVAIAIDMDPAGGSSLADEDDDKVHGFKSLATSRIVPKFTRPVTDMIDGLWVSCDRALMRQPAIRLGIIIYWAVLHVFLASFVV